MSWIIPIVGLFVLLLLTLTSRAPANRFHPDATLDNALPAYLASVARRAFQKGYTRCRKPKKLLKRLEKSLFHLSSVSAEELLPAGRWLCENGRFLQEEALTAEERWRNRPCLPRFDRAESRLLVFCREMLLHCTASITKETLYACVEAWQKETPFTCDEWQYMDDALRLTLLELLCGLAEKCAKKQCAEAAAVHTLHLLELGKTRKAKRHFESFSSEETYLLRLHALLREEYPKYFSDFLAENEIDIQQLRVQMQTQASENCLWIANAVSSLRLISKLPWTKLREEWSIVHVAMLQDSVYAGMDEESRLFYRERLGFIAKAARMPERTVCTALMTLCRNGQNGALTTHTGYYLLDTGRNQLLRQLKRPVLPFVLRISAAHKALFIVFRIFSWLCFAAFAYFSVQWKIASMFVLPFAAVSLYSLQQFLIRVLQYKALPCMVPRMAINELDETTQTLVVFPAMLTDTNQALSMVKKLSIAHQANPDPHLHFLLLGDFQDSITGTLSSDAEIIETASSAIQSLCEDTNHPFFYLQRERVYIPQERIYHSRERKRGGLETVLQLIEGRPIEDSFAFSSINTQALQKRYRYVITLDSDTILPPGSALRMIGAMLHPLNQRRRMDGRMRGASILQPRMETAAHLVSSSLSALLGGGGGTDPYNHLLAAFDADVIGHGTFYGKGILDPKPFLEATEHAVLQGSILSHDLLEGELGGCLNASDIVLYDGNPETLKGFMYRLHRWTRGDWQLLPYVFPFFPQRYKPQRKALSAVSRFKIWRNLFRSLIAPMRFLLLLYAAFAGKTWLILAVLLLPEAAFFFPVSVSGFKSFLCRLCILPSEAVIQADAIGRTVYRLWFSRQHLLEWTTSAQIAQQNHTPMLFFNTNMTAAALLAFAMLLQRTVDPLAIAVGVLWLVFPFLLPSLERSRKETHAITPYMRDVFLRVAKSTLIFFETAITPEDHALPPDNVQLEPNTGIAHRTSPTNIGLYLCSLVAAEKLHFISPDDMAQRMEETVSTLEQLPKWHGQPYNWYDTRTLAPLHPGFISSVDCGNLAVCLLTSAQAVRALLPELNAAHSHLSARLDALVESMDFSVLYDWEAEMFHVSIDPSEGKPIGSHYDLLASESRLLSFVAIMLGQIPSRHWFRLGRPQIRTRYGSALLSYSGTMFEYLMAPLFQTSTRGTLLERTCRTVIKLQQHVKHCGAYGISESGYYAFDPQLQYQYRAFGIPSLALRTESNASVLAPYASLLSAPFQPREAFANLQRMQALGLCGQLGFFEAADFDADRTQGQRMRIVRSHMAHHQGMILCAICNLLEENHLASLFSSLPRAQAYRLLLDEKPAFPRHMVRRPFKYNPAAGPASPYYMQRAAHSLCFPVDANLLHGAGTTLVVDANGYGWMSRNGVMWTRFHENCSQPSGMQLYLRDSQSGTRWCVTDPRLTRRIRFETAQAVFEHERFDVLCELRIWVDPLDGTVLHCLKLQNSSRVERVMEVCSYLEPALLPQRDANAHPAFQNLFIRTKRFSKSGLMAIRRPRENDKTECQLWHVLSADAPLTMVRMQTDRTAFLGRTRFLRNPRALDQPISAVADTLGDMIEPCLSLRGQFTVPGKGCVTLLYATHIADSDEHAEAFAERYKHIETALRSYEAALTKGMVCARSQGLNAETQALVSRIPGALIFTGQPHQHQYASQNALPSSDLCSLGISGDLPIWMAECSRDGIDLANTLLKAHAFWHMNGFWTDLILLTNCQDTANMLSEHAAHEHVHLLTHPESDKVALLRACARLVLDTAKPLAAQLDALAYDLHTRYRFNCRHLSAFKSDLPKTEALVLENGYGGFTKEGNYQITLSPGRQTPAPWCNPLCNEHFGSLASESGIVFSYMHNSHNGRLTRWTNDTLLPAGDENFFLRDKTEKLLWSLTRMPLGHGFPVRITHAPGETTYEASGYGIYSRLQCFTDCNLPFGMRVIHIRNESPNRRELTLFHVCRFSIGSQESESLLTSLSCAQDRVWVRNPCMEGAICLAAVDPRRCTVRSMSDGVFQGMFSPLPFALAAYDQLPQEEGHTAVLSFTITLDPGENCTLSTALLHGKTREDATDTLELCRREGASMRLHKVRQMWEERLGKLRFDLPYFGLSVLLSRWLPYQVQASRLWMRAGFYQAGGAIGYRDQLQDILSLLYTHPNEARKHILLCAEHQFEEGDVLHWWHPPRDGVRTRISDDKLFLPYAASLYTAITGDNSLMDVSVPYLHGAPLASEENDRYFKPNISDVTESVREHCLRAIQSVELGVHGLPLMGGGDWNDGMNLVGGEHGESVWLGMFLSEVIRVFLPYSPSVENENLSRLRTGLLDALERYAWDGAWYLRGWYNDGTPLGSSDSKECRIDLLPQAWSVLCGTNQQRSEIAMEHAVQMLYDRDAGLFKLFSPPFDGAEKPGYIAGYLPGIRENGGQYTHAACWAIAALKQLGRSGLAWEVARAILPVNHSATRQQAVRYRAEPYAMAADIYTNLQQYGRGGWTWYTGSAGWYWTVMLRCLLGFEKQGNTLRFHPTAPAEWDQLTLTYQYGSATYHLHASRDCKEAQADGQVLPQGRLCLLDDGRIHEAIFPLR